MSTVRSRAGIVETFSYHKGRPLHVKNALGGTRPAFQFTGPANNVPCLKTDREVSTKSIVLVGQLVDTTYANNYFWGKLDADRGFRLSNTYDLDDGYNFMSSGYSFSCAGDAIWMNGVKVVMDYGVDTKLTTEPWSLIVTRGESNTMTTYDNVKNGIGSYEYRACNMYISEAIAYDHCLSDDEARQINEYIKAKWFDGTAVPAAATSVFGPQSTLAVTGGATAMLGTAETLGTLKGNAAGGTLTGDVTISGFLYDALGARNILPLVLDGTLTLAADAEATVIDHDNLETGVWPVLGATVRVGESEFATINLGNDRYWRFQRADTTWRLVYNGATVIIVR